MNSEQQNVIIKGKREGLFIYFNEDCSYSDIINELTEKLSTNVFSNGQNRTPVFIETGYRYLKEIQENEIKEIINQTKNLYINSIQSLVVTKKNALQWKQRSEVKREMRIVRSGQVIESEGDLLLIGDVNPGGKLVAAGNIFVLGNLRGIAHAGASGDRQAVVVATNMDPMQIYINDLYSRAPEKDSGSDGFNFDFAYVNSENKIVIDSISNLAKIRSDLAKIERGI
ncbi:MAG: septum site-determining protein MinC [Bacillales bacterium]|jgi:septum site-determining protein MinC|nr:septum site-determining protein MinC [Bacillales bacterium]